jgi:outer membrane protein assembly factor BamA
LNRRSSLALVILFYFGLLFLLPLKTFAQDAGHDSTNYVVRAINFHGNNHVKSKTLNSLILTHTNRDFLGIPGFTLFYFIWKLTNHTFGEKPALLNFATVASDMKRITQYYNSIGYLSASTDTSFNFYHKNRVKVNFNIHEGKQSYIKSIAYSGLPDSAFKSHLSKINFYKASPLTDGQINDSTFQAHMPFITEDLNNERQRIIDYLNNHGYAAATLDSVTTYVKQEKKNPHFLRLLYQVNAGKRYRFGNLYIQLAGPGPVNDTTFTYQESDTLDKNPFTLNGQKIIMQKQASAHTHFRLLTDQILFKPGAIFSKKRYNKTLNSFQNLGMMNVLSFGGYQNQIRQDTLQSGKLDTLRQSGNTIPLYFKLQTLPRDNLGFDVFGLQRYGFGSGAGVSFSNNNIFGRAEKLSFSINGSFEYVGQKQLRKLPPSLRKKHGIKINNAFFHSIQAKLDLTLPRLVFPFAALNKKLAFSNAHSVFSLSYKRADRALFTINSDLQFNLQYQVQHNQRLASILDLLQLELLDTNPTNLFIESLENEFSGNPVFQQQILEDFRPQFTSLTSYTFRDVNTDLINRNYGHFSQYSVGVGGTVPYLIDRFVVTPGTIEGNIPSPLKFSGNELAYSQYIKFTADYRRYFRLSHNSVFAVRGFGGIAKTFGKRKAIPLNQRFYAGGSNDIRGWSLFTLGPGSIPFDKVVILGGQIKLLSQIELRETFARNFLASNWIFALFTDAGNVWYGPDQLADLNIPGSGNSLHLPVNLEKGRFKFNQFYKQIAVGSGVGLRIDFKYLILRFDIAFRLHDLQKGWFSRRSKKVHFYFGIGQSF